MCHRPLKQYLFHNVYPINMSRERMSRETILEKWQCVKPKDQEATGFSFRHMKGSYSIKSSMRVYYMPSAESGAGESVKEKQVTLDLQL